MFCIIIFTPLFSLSLSLSLSLFLSVPLCVLCSVAGTHGMAWHGMVYHACFCMFRVNGVFSVCVQRSNVLGLGGLLEDRYEKTYFERYPAMSLIDV